MLYRLRSNAFDAFVPHIVLGEVCGVIFRDCESDQDRRDKTVKLVDMMDSNGIRWENMKPVEKDAFKIMVTLSGKDESSDATDVMILSHVLSDPDSKFFTIDSDIPKNRPLQIWRKACATKGSAARPSKYPTGSRTGHREGASSVRREPRPDRALPGRPRRRR